MSKSSDESSVVYVFQRPRPREDWTPDLSSASKYGTIRFLFDIDDAPHKDPRAAAKRVLPSLSQFDPEKDFLLWANFCDPMSAWLVVFMLGLSGKKKLQFLYWNKKGYAGEPGFYYPVCVDLSKSL